MTITRSVLISLICGSILFFLYGCAPIQTDTERVEPQVKDVTENTAPLLPPKEKYFTHTIRWKGEKIVTIAEWYTGSEKNWLKIIEANPTVDPKQIKVGDSILIPEDLMKTHKLMPLTYRGSAVQSKKKSLQPTPTSTVSAPPPAPPVPALAESVPPGVDEIDLFGPIYEESDKPLSAEPGLDLPLETIE